MKPAFQIIRYNTAPFHFREWDQSASAWTISPSARAERDRHGAAERPLGPAKLNAALLLELSRLMPVLQQ